MEARSTCTLGSGFSAAIYVANLCSGEGNLQKSAWKKKKKKKIGIASKRMAMMRCIYPRGILVLVFFDRHTDIQEGRASIRFFINIFLNDERMHSCKQGPSDSLSSLTFWFCQEIKVQFCAFLKRLKLMETLQWRSVRKGRSWVISYFHPEL